MKYRQSHIFLITFLLLLLGCGSTDKAKQTPEVSKENIKVVTETFPAIIGGMEALYQQLTYPSNSTQQTTNIILKANILVNSQGKVKRISFDQDQYPQYKDAARDAIYNVRFVPGKRNGQAIDMFVTIPIQFHVR
ncbi:energy transducer TonB family protein [Fodinibius sp. SL11]|uniref:energy transducer TonB family protein n=1 Tax=Fodinibius sp. SL11 TaxID=3425690 RepID=UPI003F884D5C